MKPYPEYKETGLSWLPKIPKHWELVRAKNLYRRVVRAVRPNDDVVTCFRDGVVTLRKNRRTTGFTESLQEIGYQGIRKGDLVIHAMDAFAGAVGVSDSDGKGTPVYSVCVAKEGFSVNNYFYAYVVREMAKTGFIQSLYRGIRERSSDFRFEVFGNQELPLPPVKEQEKIVRYLDLMTAKIDKLIDAKKKQIALLQEKKQAIVNQVVTRGLNPDVQLKDSGIDWLGKIPAHWEIRPLKYFVESNLKSLSQDTDDDFSFSYIDISSVGYGYIRAELEQMRFADAPSRARRLVSVGDTIISTVRTHLRSICLIDENLKDCVVSTGFSVLHPSKHVHPQILNFVLSTDAFINSVIQNSIGISYPAIADSRLLSLKIALPPSVEEQGKIVDFILKKSEKYNVAQKRINSKVRSLQDYKDSLISSVVTGKLVVCL